MSYLSRILLLVCILALGQAAPAGSRARSYYYLPQESDQQNKPATVEAFGLGDAGRYIAKAFKEWSSNSDLNPGDPLRIIAKLLDKNGGPGAGDRFRFWAKLLDIGQERGEQLGHTWKGKDTLKDFNIEEFLQIFAKALDGLDVNGDLQVADLFQILARMISKVGGHGNQDVVNLIQFAGKLIGGLDNGELRGVSPPIANAKGNLPQSWPTATLANQGSRKSK